MEQNPSLTPEAIEARQKLLDEIDSRARMDLVAEHEYSVSSLVEELPDIPQEVYEMPAAEKVAWIRGRTNKMLDEMTEDFDVSHDEGEWHAGQHTLLEQYKQAIKFLDLLGPEDFQSFHEREASDALFRARYANSFSGVIKSPPEA
jgi:hypothetical protein